jgi:hypothetical protein
MYPSDWHRVYSEITGYSANLIMREIAKVFTLSSSVEVGCGNAHWTRAAISEGIAEYLVVDGPWNERRELLVDTNRFVEADLSEPMALGRRFDLAICLEVAEHVRPESADILIKSLTDAADVILFGAAIPYQGGFGHLNEQWPSWWRDKFTALGYQPFDLVRPRFWTDRKIHYYYRQNIFCYVNRTNLAAISAAEVAERILYSGIPVFDAVHPEKFDEVASYRAIAMKRLVRWVPGCFLRRRNPASSISLPDLRLAEGSTSM